MTRNASGAVGCASGDSSAQPQSDTAADLVARWILEKEAADVLQIKWQRLEHRLMLKMRSNGMNLIQGMRSKLPEALEMKHLMNRIKTFDRRLSRMAAQVLNASATSQADAFAKIRLGLRLQQPVLGGDVSWELVQKGFDELVEGFSHPRYISARPDADCRE